MLRRATRPGRVLLALLGPLCAIATTTPLREAFASDPGLDSPPVAEQSALALFNQGLAKYDAQEYKSAIDLFERAYRISGSPSVLFNIAQAWRLLGDCARARKYYRRFVDAAETTDSPERDRAAEWLRELGACAEPRLQVSPRAASDLSPGPLPALVIDDAMNPSLSTPVAPVLRTNSGRFGAAALFGVSFGLGCAAVLSALHARSSSADITNLFNEGGTWSDSANEVAEAGRHAEIEAIALGSAAILSALAGGIVLYISRRVETHRAAR